MTRDMVLRLLGLTNEQLVKFENIGILSTHRPIEAYELEEIYEIFVVQQSDIIGLNIEEISSFLAKNEVEWRTDTLKSKGDNRFYLAQYQLGKVSLDEVKVLWESTRRQ